jgi:hypothetical protein
MLLISLIFHMIVASVSTKDPGLYFTVGGVSLGLLVLLFNMRVVSMF